MNTGDRRQETGDRRRVFWFLVGFWFLNFNFSLFLTNSIPVLALTSFPRSCQEQDIETLTIQLLKDLPGYANRTSQRARRRSRIVDTYSYVLLAGQPEFAPLTLGPGEYTPVEPSLVEPPQQVFITTLERQYTNGKLVELQQYHWLFLTQTSSGWRLAMMFSRTGIYPGGKPPTRPRDSSQGVIAQAIRIWLRDCQAGTFREPKLESNK